MGAGRGALQRHPWQVLEGGGAGEPTQNASREVTGSHRESLERWALGLGEQHPEAQRPPGATGRGSRVQRALSADAERCDAVLGNVLSGQALSVCL